MKIKWFSIVWLLVCMSQIMAQDKDSIPTISVAEMSLEQLLSLTITSGTKKEQPINKIPASVVVITRNEIIKNGYSSLQEILNQVPGLYLWDSYHVRGRIDIGIRGYTSTDNIIILVNGVNQIEGVYNEYLLTKVGVPVEAIDRIEVIRGPMSVLYGSGAFFGVINIITNEFQKNPINQISAMYGSNQTWQACVSGKINKEDLQIGFTCSGFSSEGMDEPYSKMMTQPALLNGWGLSEDATTKNILKDKRAYVNINGIYKGFRIDMTHSQVERGGFLVQPVVSYSPSNRHSTNFMIQYQQQFGPRFKIHGKFSYLTTNALSFYFVNEKNSHLLFSYNSDAFEAEALAFYTPAKKLDITLGISNRTVLDATNPAEMEGAWGVPYGNHLSRLAIDSKIITLAGFSQVDYSPIEQIRVVGGVRFEKIFPYTYDVSGGSPYISSGRQHFEETYSYNKVYTIPSLAILYSLNKNHTLKLLYGEAMRNPPLGMLADILFSTSVDPVADFPQLIPSKIKTFEANYNGLFSSIINIHASLYHNNLSNLISQYFLNVADTTTVYYTSNRGKIKTIGSELSLTIEPFEKLQLVMSGAYQYSEVLTEGLEKVDVAYSPELLGYFRTSYSPSRNLQFFVLANYVSNMKPDYDYTSHSRLGLTTDSFFSMDAGCSYKPLRLFNFWLTVKTTNIFDTEIHYPVTTLNRFADKGILGFGRRYFMTLTYRF